MFQIIHFSFLSFKLERTFFYNCHQVSTINHRSPSSGTNIAVSVLTRSILTKRLRLCQLQSWPGPTGVPSQCLKMKTHQQTCSDAVKKFTSVGVPADEATLMQAITFRFEF